MVAVKKSGRLREFPDLFSKLAGGGCSPVDLGDCIFHELRRLLNYRAGPHETEFERFGYVKTSVVCYGVRDPTGQVGGASDYAAHLAWAIRTFETRLVPSTVKVQPAKAAGNSPQACWRFLVEGLLWPESAGYVFRCWAIFDLMEGRATLVR